LIEAYPEQAQHLLEMALIQQAPIDWKKIQAQHIQPALCCLALKENHFDVLYQEDKHLNTLLYWFLLDPIGAINCLEKHPHSDEIFQVLSLHGDLKLFAQFSPLLVSIREEAVKDPIQWMFGQQIHTRKSLSIPPDLPYIVYDPIHIQTLCEKGLQRRKFQGRGRAIELLNIREAIHAHH
jgi:hypothetical protein